MALTAGTRLGPYEILAPIGAGGLGEVYSARDTTLKRDVALKVLPATFPRDPEGMARFQREAEVLASLDHPNIGHIYGIVTRKTRVGWCSRSSKRQRTKEVKTAGPKGVEKNKLAY